MATSRCELKGCDNPDGPLADETSHPIGRTQIMSKEEPPDVTRTSGPIPPHEKLADAAHLPEESEPQVLYHAGGESQIKLNASISDREEGKHPLSVHLKHSSEQTQVEPPEYLASTNPLQTQQNEPEEPSKVDQRVKDPPEQHHQLTTQPEHTVADKESSYSTGPSMTRLAEPPPAYVAGPGGMVTSQPIGLTRPLGLQRLILPAGGAGAPNEVTSQSTLIKKIPIAPIPDCPPGLEYLTRLDTLFVRQMIELGEVLTGCETENKYLICNQENRLVFYAKEDSECCNRICCGPIRAFDMVIADAREREVIHLKRPLACGLCCFPSCLQSIQVFSPPDNLIGTVEQEWSICIPKYVVKNELGEPVLRIQGPCITFSCCGSPVQL